MPSLTITICTASRPAALSDLLAALARARPGAWPRDVVVADNGRDPETAAVIARASTDALPVRRIAAPLHNIARARNAALAAATGELVLWLDDDQLVGPTFFEDLERAWAHRPAWSHGLRLPSAPRFEAPVSGPVPAPIPAVVRAWFAPRYVHEGARVERRAFSTNGLLAPRAASLAVPSPTPEGPFDPWFGTRGGEDTDFFLRATASGLRFSTTRLATVIERVPPARANLRYMAQASFRVGFTDATLSRRTRHPLALVAEVGLRAALDLALAPLAARDPDALAEYALSLCRQAGKLWALAGRDYQHYRAR
ncbi:MAG: glycosyltransferase family 2 protein [Deltaproteobacteria bacterium]|nr:glycosyltransferase family 2 protein [Deltaproteobacteria bacterium]